MNLKVGRSEGKSKLERVRVLKYWTKEFSLERERQREIERDGDGHGDVRSRFDGLRDRPNNDT